MIVLLTLLLLCSVTADAGSTAAPIPFVTVIFEPGGTCNDCYAWRVDVFDDGLLKKQISSEPGWGGEKLLVPNGTKQVSSHRLGRLRSVLEQAQFMSLKDSYSADYQAPDGSGFLITDQDTYTIAVHVGDKAKVVDVYGPETIAGIWPSNFDNPDKESGKRICEVLAEIFSMFRAPNPWQRDRRYR